MSTEVEEFPYNNMNILIEEEEVNKILRDYGISFKCYNVDIYRKAFVHKSYIKKEQNICDLFLFDFLW